jgi:protein-disulfide isomerase
MKPMRLLTLCLLAQLALGAAPPQRGNWNATVSQTAAGGHVVGNPNAPIKLVEYLSYTCSHCAEFEVQGSSPLRLGYIAPGKVSWEIRNYIRDPFDGTAALIANCGPASGFFLSTAAFLRTQPRWLATAQRATKVQQQRWYNGDMTARRRAIASDLGFYAIAATRGLDRMTVDRCLADDALARRIAAQTVEGEKIGVTGTPSFMLNGDLLIGTFNWATLRIHLDARL